jgi:ABC-2 type transport system permease protein
MLLSISNLILFFVIAGMLKLPGWDFTSLIIYTKNYFFIAVMIMSLGTIISFVTLWSKNYLIPLGMLVIVLILSQIIPIVGLGHYFPWSVPAIYSGAAGELIKNRLNAFSYISVAITAIIGYISTIYYWNTSDHY